jgi:ABC-type multidrug transport system fused ATPase/permease subunit
MEQLRQLRRLFRVQLRLRGIVAASVVVLLILAFALITADFDAWWFDVMPWLTDSSSWVKGQNSWDLFVYVFLAVNLFAYLQVIPSTLMDRHSGRVLVHFSEQEVSSVSTSLKSVGKVGALLGARRRALESLFRADPGLYTLAVVVIALFVLGHPIAAVVLIAFAVFLLAYFPRMVKAFTSLGELQEGDEPGQLAEDENEVEGQGLPQLLEQDRNKTASVTREQRQERRNARQERRRAASSPEQIAERERQARARANERLARSAERMFIIINRPIVRLRVGWPILVAAIVAVSGVVILTIHDMTTAGQLPERGTLLILMLVLASRSCLTLAQYWEDLSFFTASLVLIDESDEGQEVL